MFIKQPIPVFLLDLLKTRKPEIKITANDLYASAPIEQEGRANTLVYFKGNPESGLTGSFSLSYAREDIGNTFRGIFPDIPRECHSSVEKTITELNKRYGTKYSVEDFTIEDLPNTVILSAKPDSYKYVGKLGIRAFYDLSDFGNIEIPDDINQVARSARHYSYPLSFATLSELSKVLPDQPKTLSIAGKALVLETMDPWVVSKKSVPYNLFGAEVTYNGASTDDSREEPLVVKIKIDPKYCTNFTGELVLFYSLPETDE